MKKKYHQEKALSAVFLSPNAAYVPLVDVVGGGTVNSKGRKEGVVDVFPLVSLFYFQTRYLFNPLRPNNDLSQSSHCDIKALSVSEVKRIENMITQMTFY